MSVEIVKQRVTATSANLDRAASMLVRAGAKKLRKTDSSYVLGFQYGEVTEVEVKKVLTDVFKQVTAKKIFDSGGGVISVVVFEFDEGFALYDEIGSTVSLLGMVDND